MWRTTSAQEKTELYKAIANSVNKQLYSRDLKVKKAIRDTIISEIFEANKAHYNLHIIQMQEFVSKNS